MTRESAGSRSGDTGRPPAPAGPGRVPPAFWLALHAACLWPVGAWFLRRLRTAPAEEPWAWLVALGLAAWLFTRKRATTPAEAPDLRPAPALLGLYLLALSWLPPILRAALGVGSLAAAASAWYLPGPVPLGLWGLLVLSLRVTPTVQLFLGYPLRLLVARGAAGLLALRGLAVTRQGTGLLFEGQEVLVDAPCSGVRMLWAGGLLTCTLAWSRELPPLRTALLMALALPALVVGNVLRTAVLFHLETGLWQLGGWAHEAAGLAAFLVVAGVVVGASRWLEPRPEPSGQEQGAPPRLVPARPQPPTDDEASRVADSPERPPRGLRTYPVLLLLAALLPLAPLGDWQARAMGAPVTSAEADFPGWPTHLHGRPLRPAPLSPEAEGLEARIPGRVATFLEGPRRVHVIWLARATRALHSRGGCSEAAGYRIRELPAWVDPAGRRWGSVLATRDGTTLLLRERVFNDRGDSFASVFSWYFSSFLGLAEGPWWYVSTQETVEGAPGSR